ncbi:MAG: hypothetical protein BRD23_04995 [Halobacteriales archaeon SW_9_67_25]|nr:MAG: hypothetical protein BRD23_04995 [Halobacteriales archaeon SW_9_67_25]
MDVDAEMVRQVALSAGAVALFVVAAVVVGRTYGETAPGTELTPTGGLALVGVLAGFILLMTLAGIWLERQDFDS